MGGCCGAMKSSHKSMPGKDKQPQSKNNTLTRNAESKVKSDKKVEANGKSPKKDQEEKVEEKQQESTNLAGDAEEVKLINPFESDEKLEDDRAANGPSAIGVSQENKVVSDDDLVVKAGEIVEETIRKSVQEECFSAKPVVEVIEQERPKDETAEEPVAEVAEEKVPAIVMETFPGDAEQKEEVVDVPVVEVIEKEVSTNVTETVPVDAAEEKILEAQESPKEQKAEDSKKVDEPVQESQPQIMPEESKEVEKALSETAVPELCPEPCQTNVLEGEVVEVKKDEEKQGQPIHVETSESSNAEDAQVSEIEVTEPLAEVPSSKMTNQIIDEKVEVQQVQNSEPADLSETLEMETIPQQQPDAQVPEKMSDSGEKCCKDKEVEPIAEEALQEEQAEAPQCEQKMSEEPVTQNVDEPKEHLPVKVEDVVPEPMMCIVEESSLGETVQLDIARPCLLAPQLEEQVPVEKSETDQELNEEKPIADTNDSNAVQPEVASETEVLASNSEAEEKLSQENAIINTDVRPEDIPESLNETSKLAEADDKSQGPETVAVEELPEEIKATETLEANLTHSHPCHQTPNIEKKDLAEVPQPETCQVAEQQVLQVETQAEEVTLQADQSNEVNQPKEETEAPVSLPNEHESTKDQETTKDEPEASNETPMTQNEERSVTETEDSVESENNVPSMAQVPVKGVEQYSNQLVEETVENALGELTVSVCSEKELKQEKMNTNSETTELEVPAETCESSCEKAEVQEIKNTLESSATLPQEEYQDDVDDAENLPPPPAPEELMFPPNVSQSEGSMPSSQDSLSLPSPPGDLNCENATDVEPQIENHCPSVEAELLPCVELKSDITCECSAAETKVEESLLLESSKSANSSEQESKKN